MSGGTESALKQANYERWVKQAATGELKRELERLTRQRLVILERRPDLAAHEHEVGLQFGRPTEKFLGEIAYWLELVEVELDQRDVPQAEAGEGSACGKRRRGRPKSMARRRLYEQVRKVCEERGTTQIKPRDLYDAQSVKEAADGYHPNHLNAISKALTDVRKDLRR